MRCLLLRQFSQSSILMKIDKFCNLRSEFNRLKCLKHVFELRTHIVLILMYKLLLTLKRPMMKIGWHNLFSPISFLLFGLYSLFPIPFCNWPGDCGVSVSALNSQNLPPGPESHTLDRSFELGLPPSSTA